MSKPNAENLFWIIEMKTCPRFHFYLTFSHNYMTQCVIQILASLPVVWCEAKQKKGGKLALTGNQIQSPRLDLAVLWLLSNCYWATTSPHNPLYIQIRWFWSNALVSNLAATGYQSLLGVNWKLFDLSSILPHTIEHVLKMRWGTLCHFPPSLYSYLIVLMVANSRRPLTYRPFHVECKCTQHIWSPSARYLIPHAKWYPMHTKYFTRY